MSAQLSPAFTLPASPEGNIVRRWRRGFFLAATAVVVVGGPLLTDDCSRSPQPVAARLAHQ